MINIHESITFFSTCNYKNNFKYQIDDSPAIFNFDINLPAKI
jgi:hypothetical protein